MNSQKITPPSSGSVLGENGIPRHGIRFRPINQVQISHFLRMR